MSVLFGHARAVRLTGALGRRVMVASGLNRVLIRRYLAAYPVAKLHIGSGDHRLPGWLNTDYIPSPSRMVVVNAVYRFPFDDDVFDYAHCEHVIEHLAFDGARTMLSETYRVLKPGGTLRLITPDLNFLIALLGPNITAIQRSYLKWAVDLLPKGMPRTATAVFNNFVRAWGHQFIFDPVTLENLLAEAGFVAIERFSINESDRPDLTGIDNAARMPDGLLQLESMVYQTCKPA